MLTSPASAWSRSVGGCICRLGYFGALGSSACLEALGIRLDMLSVCFHCGKILSPDSPLGFHSIFWLPPLQFGLPLPSANFFFSGCASQVFEIIFLNFLLCILFIFYYFLIVIDECRGEVE